MAGEIELPTLIQRIRVIDSDLARAEQRAAVFEQRVGTRMDDAAASTDKVTSAEQDLTKATEQGTAANENRRRSLIRDQPVMADRLRTEVNAVRTQQEAIRLEFLAARQRAQENADLRARTALVDRHVASLNALERQAGGTADELARMDVKARETQSKKLGFGTDAGLLAAAAANRGGGGRGRGGIGGIFAAMGGASDKGKSLGITALGTMAMFTMPTLIAGVSVLAGLASALTGGLVLASAAMAPMVGYAASIASSMIATKTAIPLFKALVAPANALSKFMETQQNQRTAFMATKPTAKQLVAFNSSQQQALTQQEAASNLSPSGITYAKTLSTFQNTVVQPVMNRAQDALLPHLTRFFHEIAPLIPTVSKGLAQIANAIGGVAERFGKLLGSASWIRMIGPLMKQDASIVANFGHTLALLADSFLRVLYSAMPLVKVMQAHQAVMARNLDRWVQAAQASGKLSGFFTTLANKAGGFTAAMGQFFQALLHIGEIATRVNSLSKPGGFLHMMTRFNDFTKSGRGIESIYRWLANSRAVLKDMAIFVGNLLRLLTGFGSQGGGVDKFFKDLNSTLIPALQILKNSMGGWIPILLHAIVELLSAAAKLDSTFTFKPVAQLADGLATVANSIAGIVRQLPGLYTVLSYGLSTLLVTKWLKSIGSLVGIKGLFGGGAKGDPALNGSARALTGAAEALTNAAGALRGAAGAEAESGLVGGAAGGRGGLRGAFMAGRRGALEAETLLPYSATFGPQAAPRPGTASTARLAYLMGPTRMPFGESEVPFGPENRTLNFWQRMGVRGSAFGGMLGGVPGRIGAGTTGFAGRLGALTSGARFTKGLGAAGIGLALGGGLLGDALRGPSGSSGTSARNLGADALQGASLGAGVGMMFGPMGAAVGGVAGAVGGLALGFLTAKSAAEKQADATKQKMKEEKAAIDQVGASLSDAMLADGFKQGAAYAQTLLDTLNNTPGAMTEMAKLGLSVKDVKDYMNGSSTATAKVNLALQGAGRAGDSLAQTFKVLAGAQDAANQQSDAVARTTGHVSDHMRLVARDTQRARAAMDILNAAKADPKVDVKTQAFMAKLKAAQAALDKLKHDVGSGTMPTLPGGVLKGQAKTVATTAIERLLAMQNDPKVKARSKEFEDQIAAVKKAEKDFQALGGNLADLPSLGLGNRTALRPGQQTSPGELSTLEKRSEAFHSFRGERGSVFDQTAGAIKRLNTLITTHADPALITRAQAEVKRLRGEVVALGGDIKKLPTVGKALPLTFAQRVQKEIEDAKAVKDAEARRRRDIAREHAEAVAAARQARHDDWIMAHGTSEQKIAVEISRLSPTARTHLRDLQGEVQTAFSKLAPLGKNAWEAINRALGPDLPLGVGLIRKGETLRAAMARILKQLQTLALTPITVPIVAKIATTVRFVLPFASGGSTPPLSRPLTTANRPSPTRATNAIGGRVTAHMATWVGERGAEIFEPDSNGRILNHQQARGMGAAAGGSASYATSFNFYGNIVATDMKAIMRQAARMAQNAAITGLAPDHAMALTGVPS